MKRLKSRGLSRFALVWIVIILCVALIWTAVRICLNYLLEEYESVQPEYAGEVIFDRYFKNATAADLVEYMVSDISVYETEAQKEEYLATVLSGATLSYKKAFSPVSTETLFAVSAGDVTFASFTVVDGAEKTELLGLSFPALGRISINLKPLYGATVYAPADAEVRVNGILLDSTSIEGDAVVLSDAVYFPSDNENSRVMVNYSVSGLFVKPTVSVKYTIPSGSSLCTERNPGESVHELELKEDNGSYSAEYSYLSLLADRYNEKILIAEEKRLAEEERKRLEEEQKRLEEEERQKELKRISDELEATYEEFILEMSEQYNDFIYRGTTASQQNKTKVYFMPGTDIYNYITLGNDGGYYNWSSYRPYENNGITFIDEETFDYSWQDEAHTKFKCRISLICKTVGSRGSTEESFNMTAYVDISGEKPLVYELITTEADKAKETD